MNIIVKLIHSSASLLRLKFKQVKPMSQLKNKFIKFNTYK